MKSIRIAVILLINIAYLGVTFAPAQAVLIPFKSSGWKYRLRGQDNGNIANGNWKNVAYNDAAWGTGPAILGYDTEVRPELPISTNIGKYIPGPTNHFRKTFTVSNPSQYAGYRIRAHCDDGMAVYLNGREIFRKNISVGAYPTPIDSAMLAVSSPNNDYLYVDTTIFVSGELLANNVIAAEVHQITNIEPTSGDIYFDLSIEGVTDFIPFKASGWKYRLRGQDNGNIANGNWKNVAYNDAAWGTGPAILGYDTEVRPELPISTNIGKYIPGPTNHFRKTFTVSNPSQYAGYRIRAHCDDGMAVYLNGREIFRKNISVGAYPTPIDSAMLAASSPNNDYLYVDTTIFVSGELVANNVIAAEVHQITNIEPTSGDIYFDLSIEGVTGQVQCSTQLLRQPYLQIGTPTSVVIRWRTNVARNSKVKFGTSPGSLTTIIDSTTAKTEHIVKLTGLTPNTKYYYAVGYSCASTDYVLAGDDANHYYYSMPNNTTDSLRFWILGDVCSNNPTGTLTSNRRQVNVRDAYMTYLGNKRLHGVIFGGDNSKLYPFDGKDEALDYNFFPVYNNQLRNTVSWISLGNHDYGPKPYTDTTTASYLSFSYPTQAEAGGIATNAKSYYSYDIGDVHFVILNPYHADPVVSYNALIPLCTPDPSPNAAWPSCGPFPMSMYVLKYVDLSTRLATFNQLQQVKWLKADLAATTKKWKIVLFHTPPYTKGRHDSDYYAAGTRPTDNSHPDYADGELTVMREYLVPILEQYKVDLIITSHTHSYERSYLMQGVTQMPTRTAFLASPNLLQNWTGTYGPTSRPYIKNAPYNGAVHVVTGNAGRGANGDGEENNTFPRPHPVLLYSDSDLSKGGSVELVVNKNRLDVRYLQLNSDTDLIGSYGASPKDQFTIMKDVNKKITYNNPTSPLTLTASWEGNYTWKIMGGSALPYTTQSIQISPLPTVNTTYIVNDGYNGGNGYLADTFMVIVCSPTLTLTNTIINSGVYQASQWIKGTNTNIISPNATVEYRAGYVELVPTSSGSAAFVASPSVGHYFLALPDGCSSGGGGGGSAPTKQASDTPAATLPKAVSKVGEQNQTSPKKNEL